MCSFSIYASVHTVLRFLFPVGTLKYVSTESFAIYLMLFKIFTLFCSIHGCARAAWLLHPNSEPIKFTEAFVSLIKL